MTRFVSAMRTLVFLAGVVVSLMVTGCGSDTPSSPQLSEQERKEMIRQDVERMMQERQQGKPRPPR